MLSERSDFKFVRGPNLIVEVKVVGASDASDLDSLPRPVATLLRKVKLGVSREELMQNAFRLGLSPMWEVQENGVGVMHIVVDEVSWGISCKYRFERIH